MEGSGARPIDDRAALLPCAEARGARVPKLGFGTWQINGRDCVEAVTDALAIGYRHIDTAAAYDNEAEVGEGIARSGVDRSDIWLTTKVWMDDLAPSRLRASAERSLRLLQTDWLDLLLIHWPNPEVPLEHTSGAMMELVGEGKLRHPGVSNFPAGMFRHALELAPCLTDQVEYHPFLGQPELLSICTEQDALLTAYAPLAHGKVPHDPVLQEIGHAHGKTAGQVALRWLIDQERVLAVPKASSPERRRENFDVWDFSLTDEERSRIDGLPKDRREFNPPWAPDWDA